MSLVTDYININWNDHSELIEDSSGKTNKNKSNDKACNSKDSSQWQCTYEIKFGCSCKDI